MARHRNWRKVSASTQNLALNGLVFLYREFPSGRVSTDPRSGMFRRHHAHESALQKAVNQAARDCRRGRARIPLALRPGCGEGGWVSLRSEVYWMENVAALVWD